MMVEAKRSEPASASRTIVVPDPAAAFVDAEFGYDAASVLRHVDLEIGAGEMVGLLGPSGAGKTTLLKALLGQIAPRSGRVRVNGIEPRRGRGRVGYVPQLDTVDWSFPVTVSDVVGMGVAARSGIWPWLRADDRRRRDEILERLSIAHLAGRHIRALSGGQQQRVFLARALVRRPTLLVLDEPTSGVDASTRCEVIELLREQHDEGMTVVLTTHDLNGVAAKLPRLVALNGRIVADGAPRDVFTPTTLRATFGADMIVLDHDGMILTADLPGDHSSHVHHGHVHHGTPHVETLSLFVVEAG